MRPLIELIHATREPIDYPLAAAQLPIHSITSDSRHVLSGSLFVALKGKQSDGSAFIASAHAAGAVAVLCDNTTQVKEQGMAVLKTPNPRKVLAHMAAKFYGRQPEHMAAVTGTDGKTSTADFFRQFWQLMGQDSASIGTLGILSGSGEMLHGGSHTTPDPVHLHKLLADLADKGVHYAGMEASSHGLHQCRLDGVKLEAAAFTNLTRDHLDYHGTEDHYFNAKARLFTDLLPKGGVAVLNQDDARFAALRQICEERGHEVIGFGRQGDEFRVVNIEPTAYGQKAEVLLFEEKHVLEIPVVGAFQVMNILTALGLVLGTGGTMDKALAAVGQLKGVPGRLEQVVRLTSGATVFIDYAHTPMALANILNTLKPHAKGRLHVVFGCGGDRDPGKRPQMGEIADMLADDVIVTDDNPRSENPASIRKAIMATSLRAKEVADRREAIYVALKALQPGDILVIAGKGHEKTQIVGDKTYPFDDAAVARQAAKELKLAA